MEYLNDTASKNESVPQWLFEISKNTEQDNGSKVLGPGKMGRKSDFARP
jgi:hypothetical protein